MDHYTAFSRCVVRLETGNGSIRGTGFFVLPGLVLTSRHVVAKFGDATIYACARDEKRHVAVALAEEHVEDFALLSISDTGHRCVRVGVAYTVHDDIFIYGFTSKYPDGDSATLQVEGETSHPVEGRLIKLKGGQISRGMSGAPVLNCRTMEVVGVVKTSRDVKSDRGGRATPLGLISQRVEGLLSENRSWHLTQSALSCKVRFQTAGPLPLDSAVYVARSCDQALRSELQRSGLIAIQGPYQIGKTSLLYRAHQYLGSSWDHVHVDIPRWCSTTSPAKFESDLFEVIGEATQGEVRSWVGLHRHAVRTPILITFDELGFLSTDPAIIGPMLKRLSAYSSKAQQGAGIRFVATTNAPISELYRVAQCRNPRDVWHEIHVGVLTSEEALQLVQLLPVRLQGLLRPLMPQVLLAGGQNPSKLQWLLSHLVEPSSYPESERRLTAWLDEPT